MIPPPTQSKADPRVSIDSSESISPSSSYELLNLSKANMIGVEIISDNHSTDDIEFNSEKKIGKENLTDQISPNAPIVKFSKSDPILDSKSYSLSHLKKGKEWEAKIKQRVLVQERLKQIHGCLEQVACHKNLTLFFKEEGWLGYCPIEKLGHHLQYNESIEEFDQCLEMNELLVLDFIYMSINDSIFADNYFYSDCKGTIFSLFSLDELILTIYPETTNMTRNAILELLEDRRRQIQHVSRKLLSNKNKELLLPKPQGEKWTEQTTLHRYTLQRLDSVKEPYDDPNHLIISPHEYLFDCISSVKAKDLFADCVYLLNLPEQHMPYKRKITLLHFLKSFVLTVNNGQRATFCFEKSLFEESLTAKVQSKYKDDLISNLCEEVDLLAVGIKIEEIKKTAQCQDVMLQIDFFLKNKLQDKEGLKKTAACIAKDLKMLAASTFSVFFVQESLKMKSIFQLKPDKVPQHTIYSNQLVDFVRDCFLNVLKGKYLTKQENKKLEKSQIKEIRAHFFYIFNVFLEIGLASVDNHDYLSAMAIFEAIQLHEIKSVLNHKESPIFSDDMKKRIDLMMEVSNADNNFDFLKQKMEESQKNHDFFIPYIQLWMAPLREEKEMIDEHSHNSHLSHLSMQSLISSRRGGLFLKKKEIFIKMQEFFTDFRCKFESVSQDFHFETNAALCLYQKEKIYQNERIDKDESNWYIQFSH